MYERQEGGSLEIGSYAHRPMLYDPDEIPSIEESALSPTELPFTQADFELQMEQALELMPEIVGDESVGVKYAINGLLSVTADGLPLLGETPEVRGPVVGRRGLDQGGPGRRQDRRRADGRGRHARSPSTPPTSPASTSPRRRARTCVRARARASTRCTGSSIRRSSGSPTATSGSRPFHARERELGAVFYQVAGLGAPALVRVQRAAARGVRRPRHAPRERVGGALVVADHQRRAPRAARARGDDRPLRVRDLRHRRARRARRRAAPRACARWTCPSAAPSTRRC